MIMPTSLIFHQMMMCQAKQQFKCVARCLTNLKYAVEEEAAAVATEAEAARDVGQAALDQTEAELLQEKAEALDASVAEAQATELGGAEAVAGEQAAEDVGGSEIAEQVEEVASSVVKGLGELPANGMASVGASEAVADAAAEAVAGAAVSSVGVDAALAGAAGAIAEQGPKVVVAAQEEWALGSEEIQAANDERLAVEKEVQATALEGDVPVLEAGSYSSHDAAVASALTAAGYLAAASAAQMVVLMVQGPLALAVLTQWLLSAGASAMHQVAKVRTQDYDSLWLTGLVAQVALYGAVASMMVNPWADIVVMAARFEEVGDAAAQQLWGVLAAITGNQGLLCAWRLPGEPEAAKLVRATHGGFVRTRAETGLESRRLGLGRCAEPKIMQQSSSKGLKKQGASQDDEPFRNLATEVRQTNMSIANGEVLDLSLFAPETSRNFESDQESDITYCLLLSVLSSKRTLGLGAYWDEEDDEKRVCLLVLAVEDDGGDDDDDDDEVKDVLSNPGVTKIHAGDGNELRERLRTSFGVDLRGELDLRTQAKAPQAEKLQRIDKVDQTPENRNPRMWRSSVELDAQQAEVVAKRALLCWKHAEQLQPKAKAGPVPTDADMQKHIDGADLGTKELEAQHKRRMVLSGILEDDQILPPVPPSLAVRGIVLQKGKDGVDSHLHGAKHLHKEGREPELQLTADLAKEGFVLSAAGELECRLCEAGPFRDRQSLRLHRQSLQHRGHGDTCARMEEELRELPGYCNLLGNAFCCFLCDVSAPSLDGMLQHLAGKSHRKACQAHGEPEPLILCKDLVCDQVSDVYPLQGRLRDVDLEPIFRKGAGTWQEAGPGHRKSQGVAASQDLPKPRAMVSKDDVENGGEPSYLAAKVGDKVVVVSDVWAEIDEQRGWFPRDALVKKLPPWKLKKAASKTAKATGPTAPAPPRVMVVRAEPLNLPDVPVGQQLLHAEAGDEVTILMVGEGGDWVWAECKGEHGMFPRRFLEERKSSEQVQGVLESDSDFELRVTPPETPLDWSDVGRRRFDCIKDVTEAFLRVVKMREERLESQQMSASEILKEAVRKTAERTEQASAIEPVADSLVTGESVLVAGAEHAAEEATKEGEKVVNEVENATLQ
ncbi:unnamed protein product, partial [Symbiodinium microadriaticum]